MPIITIILIALIIQSDVRHIRAITFFSFIAPFQSDVADEWISKGFDIDRSTTSLSHDFKIYRWSFLILFYVSIFYIESSVVLFKFSPATNPLFNVNNRITITTCAIFSKLPITILEWCQLRRYSIFIGNGVTSTQ